MVESAARGVVRIEKVVALLRRYAREGFPTEPTRRGASTSAVQEVTALVVAPTGQDAA